MSLELVQLPYLDQIEGRNTGARLTIPLEVSKTVAITTAASSDATPSESI